MDPRSDITIKLVQNPCSHLRQEREAPVVRSMSTPASVAPLGDGAATTACASFRPVLP